MGFGFSIVHEVQSKKQFPLLINFILISVVSIQLTALNSNSQFFQELVSTSITILQIHLSQKMKCMENIIVDISSAVSTALNNKILLISWENMS